MGKRDEFNRLVDAALEAGWELKKRSGHRVLYPTDGSRPIAVPTSPSDGHAYKNMRARLRQSGLKV